MSYQSLSEKYSIISKLIEIAKADGMVNMSEVSYIFWIAQHLHISELELQRLFEKSAPTSNPFVLNDRIKLFHKCLTIMSIDGNLAPEEILKCEQIAGDLRLPLNQTKKLVDDIQLQSKGVISLEELNNYFS